MKYRILIVDDHLVVKTGVAIILKNQIDDLDFSYASNFPEMVEVINEAIFDLIILDINIPGGKQTEMIADIRSVQPNVKILIFSAHDEEFYALRYIHAGADGYLNKLSGEDKIIEAVSSIIKFGKYLTNEILNKLNDSALLKEIFSHSLKTNQQIDC